MAANDGGAQFEAHLSEIAASTETLLDRLLGPSPAAGERARPERLLKAMRYASLGGGKRFRPFLVVESAALFAVPQERSLMAAAALECVHCYSLVHDDMPAMDNDDLRRGRPTLHRAFDEATAILVGDSLLTFAFDILARPETHPDPAIRSALVLGLARAAGLGGMAGGQMLDLAAEGRFAATQPQLDLPDVEQLQAMKTGALLRYACVAGAILGSADGRKRTALDRFGATIGEAFQIADDILDVEGDVATVGKATRKDADARKATAVGILGVAQAKKKLFGLIEQAEAALAPFGRDAALLQAAARFVAERRA
ncbi:MAG TPA: farnesyl diphosphate synthase [Xanthobacteraceae bacterium]|nr:farnesyl diphosphate synthase [Xanthobacteraceae bacterium]